MKPRHLVACLPLALAALGVNAAQITQSLTQAETFIDWQSFQDFAQFDPTLGTLNSITFDLSAVFNNSATYFSSNPAAYTADFSETLSLLDAAKQVLQLAPVTASIAGNFGGVTSSHGITTTQLTPVELITSILPTDVTSFSSFIGQGTRKYGIDASIVDSSATGGGSSAVINLTAAAGATLKLTYDYTAAVPEPQSYAMFLAGLGLITATSLYRRRRSPEAKKVPG